MTAHEPKPGEILAGSLKVEGVLGRGSMGVVVSVVHTELKHRRAVKLMLESAAASPQAVERFLREARMVAKLQSPHVVRVFDMGRLEGGAPYIVMELLEGTDLKSVLEGRGRLPAAEAASYLLQACDALAEAHAARIVHRDLKPSNLFLATTARGSVVKLIDFGIAKSLQEEQMEMTGTSQLLGTPLYMSPEQMRSTKNVDLRTDIWSLGVILYRMLTGRTPFSGSTVPEICMSVIGDQPDPPSALAPDVPKALDAVVARCLEKNPARRYADVAALVADLRAAVAPPSPVVTAPAPQPVAAAPYVGAPQAPPAAQPPRSADPLLGTVAMAPAPRAEERSAVHRGGTAILTAQAPAAAPAPLQAPPPAPVAPPPAVADPRPPAPSVPVVPAAPSPDATAGAWGASTPPQHAPDRPASVGAAGKRSGAGAAVLVVALLGLGGGGAWLALSGGRSTARASGGEQAPASSAPAAPPSAAPSAAPPEARATASAESPPLASSPAPTSEPPPSAVAAPRPPGAAPPRVEPRASSAAKPPPRPRNDAFGNDRK